MIALPRQYHMASRPPVRSKLLLFVLSLSLSLAAAELALRAAFRSGRSLPAISFRPDLFQRFDPYGYRLWPSMRTNSSRSNTRAW
jgi:hypothetical protein